VDERAQPDKEPPGVDDARSATPAGGWRPTSNGASRDTNGARPDGGRRLRATDTPWSSAGAALEPSTEPASSGWRRSLTSGLRGRTEVRSRYADLLAPVSPALPPTAPPDEVPASAPPYPYEGDLDGDRAAAQPPWSAPQAPPAPAPPAPAPPAPAPPAPQQTSAPPAIDRPGPSQPPTDRTGPAIHALDRRDPSTVDRVSPAIPPQRTAPPAELRPSTYPAYPPSAALTDDTFDDLPALAQAAAASQAAQAAAQAASAVQAARAAEAAAEAQAVVEDHAAVEAAYRAAQSDTDASPQGPDPAPEPPRRLPGFRSSSGPASGDSPEPPRRLPDFRRSSGPASGDSPEPPRRLPDLRSGSGPASGDSPEPPRRLPDFRGAPADPRVPGSRPAEFRSPSGGRGQIVPLLPAPPVPPAPVTPPPAPVPPHPPGETVRHDNTSVEPGRPMPPTATGPPVLPHPGAVSPLPQRIPAPPDVPEVPEDEPDDQFIEPGERVRSGLAPPELARIATHLRYDEDLEEQPTERPDGFDVDTVLSAVRLVPGVRDAQLRPNPGGVHTLRLDLADGADPGQVSRMVARLLKQKMGLAAEPRRHNPLRPAGPPNLPRDPALPRDVPIAGAPPAPRTPLPPAVTEQLGGVAPAGHADDRARHRVTPVRVRDSHGDGEPRRIGRGSSGPRVMIDQVQVSTLGLDATVEVRLTSNGAPAYGVASGPAVDGYVLRLAAVAATNAIDQLLSSTLEGGERQGRSFVEHAAVVPFGSCEVAVVVVLLVYGGTVEQLSGSALVAGDPRQAIVRATLAAVNRRLDGLLS